MRHRKIFVAGATGATGQVLVPMGFARGLTLVPHVRPQSAAKAHPRAVIFDLADADALRRAMSGCSSVLQLIGTMRQRFAQGDTYETSDIGTTRQLAAAARAVGVDHFLLLSSVGAGRPVGAYLNAKAEAEQVVVDSAIPYTIFRPSALVGGERKRIPFAKGLTRMLRLPQYEPILLEELAGAMLHVAAKRDPVGAILEGKGLWEAVARAAR